MSRYIEYNPSQRVAQTVLQAQWQHRLEQIPRQLEQLSKSGQKRCLGYTAEIAVSEQPFDHGGLIAMAEAVERTCDQLPAVVLADWGYYATSEVQAVKQRGADVLVPTS